MSKRKSAPRMTQDSGQAGVQLQTPRGKTVSQTAHTSRYFRSQPTKAKVKPTRIPHFLAVIFALALAYIAFTIGTMVPQARAHFWHLLIHPSPEHFLKAE